MGAGLAFEEGRGPVLDPPVRSRNEFRKLHTMDPVSDVPFVLETIRILRKELDDRVPLIGFSGAPFTLASYLIEGGTTRSFLNIKKMMYGEPDLFASIMDLITDVTISYLNAQVEAGVQAVQVFDTWAGILPRAEYSVHALPYVKRIMKALADVGVPRIYFVYDGGHLMDLVKQAGSEVMGLDWRTDISMAVRHLGNDIVLQGNLDPCAMFLPEDMLREKIAAILDMGREARAHIFNLGHGVLPEIPPDRVKLAVDLAHELSAGRH
jgi:uroporphyrinogen decarboxylase